MSDKFSGAFSPPISGQVIAFPNDVQQLTIKDATILIGSDHSQRSRSAWGRCTMVLGFLMAFGMGAMVMSPTIRQFSTVVVVGQMADSRHERLPERTTTESSTTTTRPQTVSNEQNVTVLYSMVNPTASLPYYYQVTSVYVAAAYQTTLSFFIQSGPGYVYLDDVSITNNYGRELLKNGNFENTSSSYTSYGWLNANINAGSDAHEGQHYHSEGTYAGRNISQTFYTTPGDILKISFWVRWTSIGSPITTKATIYSS